MLGATTVKPTVMSVSATGRPSVCFASALAEGLEQTADYADRIKANEAHLVIFNRDAETPWDDKIWQRRETHRSHAIDVWAA